MQSPPPPPFHLTGDDMQAVWPAPPVAPAVARPQSRLATRAALVAALVAGALGGVLLGGRVSAEDGLAAARDALAAGQPARAVAIDDDIAARAGFLVLLDPGAAARAAADGQRARIAWAQQLAAGGAVDAACKVLDSVGAPAVALQAATVRTHILVTAAEAALTAGHPLVALQRYDQALSQHPPLSLVASLNAQRGAAEVPAAAALLQAGNPVDAVSLLDDAAAHGAAAPAQPYYGPALLAAARTELASQSYQQAAATLDRLLAMTPGSSQARTARAMLHAPQAVAGTLVDSAGHPASGRVRLGSHYTSVSGGYQTYGPFYYGTADAHGDFSIASVPVGGPYVLEYFRNGSWMTLVDPRTDQPANPVTVTALTPVDLTFIVLPA
ncbi:MAG: tetratricopeptide repeat protein [Candidatus Dormibacteria bacterium]